MKIRKIIKKNIFGFVLGSILFGVISTVVATTYASSTVAYTTSANNNVETVEDAVVDLYDRILGYPIECYNGVCGKVSYRYWNNNFAGSTGANLFNSTHMPATTYASREALATAYGSNKFTNNPIYIRSILIDGNVVGHQACLWNNNKEFCFGPGYWAGTLGTTDGTIGTNTKIKLQREMQNALSLESTDISCNSGANYARCGVGVFRCDASYSGLVGCYSSVAFEECNVDASGSAYCYE